MTKEKKEELITDIDTKVITLRDKINSLSNNISDINAKFKKQKPEEILKAENERRELIKTKSEHQKSLRI